MMNYNDKIEMHNDTKNKVLQYEEGKLLRDMVRSFHTGRKIRMGLCSVSGTAFDEVLKHALCELDDPDDNRLYSELNTKMFWGEKEGRPFAALSFTSALCVRDIGYLDPMVWMGILSDLQDEFPEVGMDYSPSNNTVLMVRDLGD